MIKPQYYDKDVKKSEEMRLKGLSLNKNKLSEQILEELDAFSKCEFVKGYVQNKINMHWQFGDAVLRESFRIRERNSDPLAMEAAINSEATLASHHPGYMTPEERQNLAEGRFDESRKAAKNLVRNSRYDSQY